MNMLNDAFLKQAETLLKEARLPENFQSFAQESVARSREAYGQLANAAADQLKTVDTLATTAQAGVRTLGEKALSHFAHNTEAAFAAADALSRTTSLPEAAKVHVDFVQAQLAAMGAQTQEMLQLSTTLAQQAFVTMNGAATKSFEKSQAFAQAEPKAKAKR